MPNIINLLPDHLANQIAAGEVIQRPASAVKELLENAIDAGADEIQLILKEAGKELIQVIDNGKGMSPMDARMCFERHATSKIEKIDDLFAIKTMGFRGEALASIAAVAQVDVKTKQKIDELGTSIVIEASNILSQELVNCEVGTNFSIKNLFYNVPARRKFLKSNTSELKHIIEEFTRVAMAYPNIKFQLYNNGSQQFNLEKGNLKARIVGLLGNNWAKHLIPVEEKTDLLNITGFVGKPEAATKSRGNQFFFVNDRFIKSAYLNHAVTASFDGMIKDSFPFYVLFIELDPTRVDINVHPTKQEVKFEDEKIIYAYMHSAVKHSLAKYNIAPSIDFSINAEIFNTDAVRLPQNVVDKARASNGYLQQNFSQKGQAGFIAPSNDMQNWKRQKEVLFTKMEQEPKHFDMEPAFPEIPILPQSSLSARQSNEFVNDFQFEDSYNAHSPIIQWRQYVITTIKSGFLLLNPRRALERIIFDKLQLMQNGQNVAVQQLLFPVNIELSPADSILFDAYLAEFIQLGYLIEKTTEGHYTINGTPSDMPSGNEQNIVYEVVEQIKNYTSEIQDTKRNLLIKILSKRLAALESGRQIDYQGLIAALFASNAPEFSPSGRKIFTILSANSLDSML